MKWELMGFCCCLVGGMTQFPIVIYTSLLILLILTERDMCIFSCFHLLYMISSCQVERPLLQSISTTCRCVLLYSYLGFHHVAQPKFWKYKQLFELKLMQLFFFFELQTHATWSMSFVYYFVTFYLKYEVSKINTCTCTSIYIYYLYL